MSLLSFLQTLRNHPKNELLGLNEADSRRWIIDQLLKELGWNTERFTNEKELEREYPIRKKRVDYCLQIKGDNQVFIEAKKPNVTLDRHQPQLFDYVRYGDTKLSILTNSLDWWFYLPTAEGPWQHKPYVTLNLLSGDIEQVEKSLSHYLSKGSIQSGIAFEEAKTALKGRQRAFLVEDALPRAWKKLVFDEDEEMVNLLSDRVEKSEGRRPEQEDVVNFLLHKRKSYAPIEAREEKKREKQLSSGRQKRHKPAHSARKETQEFNKIILGKMFSGTFNAVPPYQTMYGSSGDLVYFAGYNKLGGNWWYRVGRGQWTLLSSDTRQCTLCFTNAQEKAAYIIPVTSVQEQVRLKQWDRDNLEVNIDFVNHYWRDLEWDVGTFFQRFD
jgi:predicted type IV restriction endonuclease